MCFDSKHNISKENDSKTHGILNNGKNQINLDEETSPKIHDRKKL